MAKQGTRAISVIRALTSGSLARFLPLRRADQCMHGRAHARAQGVDLLKQKGSRGGGGVDGPRQGACQVGSREQRAQREALGSGSSRRGRGKEIAARWRRRW